MNATIYPFPTTGDDAIEQAISGLRQAAYNYNRHIVKVSHDDLVRIMELDPETADSFNDAYKRMHK